MMSGFPCGSAGKESICNAGDLGLIPGLGKSPREGKGYAFQYSGLENSMDCTVHGVTKSQTLLSNFHFIYDVRMFFNFILLHVVVQFSQNPIIEEDVFYPLYILASFVKDKLPLGVWVYFWAFYLATLICVLGFVPLPYCLDDCSIVE